jgi:ArsR family transcriptional regulator
MNDHKRIQEEKVTWSIFFKALSEETRLRIMGLVLEQELCVCEIEAALV